MRKEHQYKCMFSSRNDLTGERNHYCLTVKSYSVNDAIIYLRGLGYHIGHDFCYLVLC